ncbi:MAG TPA: SWIB/MDM2 domain-containing protein [Vicinamibacterales bacterium]|nr:SWIB/MDM2 domain-containing protein [Vicinamibacterales bacterium]
MAKKSAKRASAGRARSAKKTAKKSAKKTARKSTKRAGGGRGRANAAFMAPVNPDAALGAVVGEKPMPRTEITKKLWAYIKKNGLQDSKNRRNINADAKLKPVFNGKATVSMFEMTKLVSKHVK